MKTNSVTTKSGSVLLIALLTITILTMICATSLYITSQNANAGMQTASWQQALTGAESGVDAAIRALNEDGVSGSNAWTNWRTVSLNPGATPPPTEPPSGTGSAASAAPSPSPNPQYNYLPSSALALNMPVGSEGATSVSAWVTVDTAGMTPSNGKQWYRIRSTGQTIFPTNSVMSRVSNNRLDYILRNTMALHFNRKGGTNLGPSRTIEVIAQSTASSSLGIVSHGAFTMGGGSGNYIDSFNSNNGPYDLTVKDNPLSLYYNSSHGGNVGILNVTGSNLNNGAKIYGSLTYSGNTPPAANWDTSNITGGTSTPFNQTVPPVSAPNWSSGSYSTQLPAADPKTGVITIQGDPNANPATGTATNPLRYQVSSIVLSGKQTIAVQSPTVTTTDPKTGKQIVTALPGYDNVQVWVTGTTTDSSGNSFSTSGNNAGITLDSNANVKIYVQGSINLTGQSILNAPNANGNETGLAQNLWIYGVSPTDGSTPTAYIAGNNNFIGVLDAPAYNVTIAGGGVSGNGLIGAVISNTLTIQGGNSVHYDEALSSLLPGPTTYSFASWFEDNSDPNHKVADQNGNYNPIVY